ncbi:hypothetical protein CC86DRAFT_7786 [Ophiobolus disseminans]|uniref:Uncharacterized protein n=1 Tax=Ophiobolus disseminans TaxID=1469910 RepID=A0A6A7AJ16_9PLEO|nr:hypothetical protein CC86DRAFT_7786 [Ophiobolus disseminans]
MESQWYLHCGYAMFQLAGKSNARSTTSRKLLFEINQTRHCARRVRESLYALVSFNFTQISLCTLPGFLMLC